MDNDFLCLGIVACELTEYDKHNIEYEDLVLFYPKNVYDKQVKDINMIANVILTGSTKLDMCKYCFEKLKNEGFFKPIKLFF